ncbi:hypothetical protein GCM10022251_66020 [Phytohabitans flavus]|uniref:MalT-like TPR region domain-containing protein n=1 Tax=Phytohabitans flavus TaxID=1076124 RepID=A0A6F8Y983_9ACTN|nr:hypothetical protein Pflav_090940 [Phytohabitans flavus]
MAVTGRSSVWTPIGILRWLFSGSGVSSHLVRIVAFLGLVISVLQTLDYAFGKRLVPHSGLGYTLIVLATVCLYTGNEAIRLGAESRRPPGLTDAFVQQITELQESGRHEAVVRYHKQLSRLLWVEGQLESRIRIGRLIEHSAALIGNKRVQAGILIDDLGWTNVAVGRFDEARGNISYGIDLAEECDDRYLAAKGLRHLGGLADEQGDYATAKAEFGRARDRAQTIQDEPARSEMLAGIDYGEAQLALHVGQVDQAVDYINASEARRLASGDDSRIVRTYALKGQILEKRNEILRARDSYVRGLELARRVGRIDEQIRNLQGLARVTGRQGDRGAANAFSKEAADLKAQTPIPYDA